jgi:hypothetical protein
MSELAMGRYTPHSRCHGLQLRRRRGRSSSTALLSSRFNRLQESGGHQPVLLGWP